MKQATPRGRKVNEEVKRIVAALLREEGGLFLNVTINEVQVSPDLQLAKVFVTLSQDRETLQTRSDILSALKGVQPQLRKALAQNIHLKYIPKLIFLEDKTLDQAARIEALLNDPRVKQDLE